MSPEEVERLARMLAASRGTLEHAAREANTAALVSLNPLTYAIQPGGLLIAPWAVGGTQIAAAKVCEALTGIDELVGHLIAEALQQRNASGGGRSGSIGPTSTQHTPIPPVGVSPAEMRKWWDSLTTSQRESIIRIHPEWIGNVDGIPFTARDQANRLLLRRIIDDPSTSPENRATARKIDDAIIECKKSMPGTPFQLTMLDLSDPVSPKAAVSVGDSDSADYVSPVAFGISTNAANPKDSLKTAMNLQRETGQQLAGTGRTSATVMWLGYDSGDISTVTGESKAILGAPSYSHYLDGIRAANPSATVVAVGHSYGTRMISYALSTGGQADAVVLLGSPGVADTVTSASQLNVPPGQVYSGRSSVDLVAGPAYRLEEDLVGQGRDNPDPQDPSFGARLLKTETSLSEGLGHGVYSDNPGAYLGTGSPGVRATARVIINARH